MAWVCSQCGQGWALDFEQGLTQQEVMYSAAVPANARGKPYWVAEGRVNARRATYSGSSEREAQEFWSQPRLFVLPAFPCPIETMLEILCGYLSRPPQLQAGPPASFVPVVVARQDVQAFADLAVVTIEAGRKDKLKNIDMTVALSSPVLWILP
jgi:hypothetical protein